MKLGYVLVYVADVAKSVDFYGRAFGLAARLVTEDGKYAEPETGATARGFVARAVVEGNLPPGTVAPLDRARPAPAVEIALVTDDVPAAVTCAVNAGAAPVAAPKDKRWDPTIAYVRDLVGVLITLCTPMEA